MSNSVPRDPPPHWGFTSDLPFMVWPVVPGQQSAQKLAMLFAIEQQQWRSAHEFESAQFSQLEHLIDFARTTVPHYRKVLPPTVAGVPLKQSWQDIPVLTRQALREAGDTLRSEQIPSAHGRVFENRTSGSTGQMVTVLGTALTNLFWQVFCLRDHLWHRRQFSEKLFSIRYLRTPEAARLEVQRASGWGNATADVARTGESMVCHILTPIPALARQLVAENPGYLLGHPSVLSGIAEYCLAHGMKVPALREVRSLGETIPDQLRDLCSQAWNAPLTDMYSCQEAGYLALQCPDHPHLHVQSENVFLEVVDGNGQPCSPGEVGRVLITSLNNFATPLIRYELGDYAELGAPCACGRGLPVLKRVLGRYRNLLTYPDGTQRWPLLGNEGRLREIAPVTMMQLVQTKPDELEARLVMPRPLTPAEQEQLARLIAENQGYPFKLSFRYVDTIRNPVNGKLEQFISLL